MAACRSSASSSTTEAAASGSKRKRRYRGSPAPRRSGEIRVTHRGHMSEEGVQLLIGVEHAVLGKVVGRLDRLHALAPRLLVNRLGTDLRRLCRIIRVAGGHPRPLIPATSMVASRVDASSSVASTPRMREGTLINAGTTWGPHVVREPEQSARSRTSCPSLGILLSCPDAYSNVLGVKGSPVQIRPSRPVKDQVRKGSGASPAQERNRRMLVIKRPMSLLSRRSLRPRPGVSRNSALG